MSKKLVRCSHVTNSNTLCQNWVLPGHACHHHRWKEHATVLLLIQKMGLQLRPQAYLKFFINSTPKVIKTPKTFIKQHGHLLNEMNRRKGINNKLFWLNNHIMAFWLRHHRTLFSNPTFPKTVIKKMDTTFAKYKGFLTNYDAVYELVSSYKKRFCKN